jgi:hypothetical protein
MVTDPIAELQSPSGLLISVYVNRHPRGSSAQLTDLLKPLRGRINGQGRSAEKTIRNDLDRIQSLGPRLDAESAPAVAIFAAGDGGIFSYQALTAPVWDHASIGPRAYLRPLRAMPRPLRTAVVVADRRRVSIYAAYDGSIEALGPPLESDRLKANYGGFSGYDEHRVRHHADEATSHLWKEAAARVFAIHQQKPFDLLTVGGHEESLDGILSCFHPYLRSLPTGRFVTDPHALTPATLRQQALEQAATVRNDRQRQLVDGALRALDQGNPACAGVDAVLAAANQRAIDHLLVAERFVEPGIYCPACRHLAAGLEQSLVGASVPSPSKTGLAPFGRSDDPCPVCGKELFLVVDVIAELIEEVLASGGKVSQVSVPSRLDYLGILATLRFGPVSA